MMVCYIHGVLVLSDIECLEQRASFMIKGRMSDGPVPPIFHSLKSSSLVHSLFRDGIIALIKIYETLK